MDNVQNPAVIPAAISLLLPYQSPFFRIVIYLQSTRLKSGGKWCEMLPV